MVGLAGKLKRDRKYMSGTTFYFCHVIDKRYHAAKELNVNNGLKFDTNLFFEHISSLARRRQGNNTIWIAVERLILVRMLNFQRKA